MPLSPEGRAPSLDYLTHNWPRRATVPQGSPGGENHGPAARKVSVSFKCKSISCLGWTQSADVVAMPLYCRRWDCASCGQFQRRRLRRRLLAGQPTTFITLTVNPRQHPSPDEAFKAASLAINRLFKVLRRRYPGQHLEYGLVWEVTKKGFPHAHILLRAPYIPQAFLSRTWRRLSGAQIVDIRQVRTEGQAASYVSKYLAKQPAVPPGYRRYRFSQLYAAAPPKSRLTDLLSIREWTRSAAPLGTLVASLIEHGFRLHEIAPELYTTAAIGQLPRPPPPS